jgi:hypothetical protein
MAAIVRGVSSSSNETVATSSLRGAAFSSTPMEANGSSSAPLAILSSSLPDVENMSSALGVASSKPLKTPEEVLGQLTWNAEASHTACGDDTYAVSDNLFGLVKHMDGKDDGNFYPSDKAVAWASGAHGLEKNLRDCCGKTAEQCLCNIAKNVGLLDESNKLYTGTGKYSFIAFAGRLGGDESNGAISVVQPTWSNLASVLPDTFAWVFSSMTLTSGATERLHDASQCGLAATMQTLQGISEQFELGSTDAYKHVFQKYKSPQCDADYCPCKGWPSADDTCDALCKDGYCGDDAVELFCGEGGREACDPSQFLCSRDDGNEVGYVRAYLEMFLDCVPVFQGNGCSSGSEASGDCVKEFIAVPNPQIKTSTASQVLADMSDDVCSPDN